MSNITIDDVIRICRMEVVIIDNKEVIKMYGPDLMKKYYDFIKDNKQDIINRIKEIEYEKEQAKIKAEEERIRREQEIEDLINTGKAKKVYADGKLSEDWEKIYPHQLVYIYNNKIIKVIEEVDGSTFNRILCTPDKVIYEDAEHIFYDIADEVEEFLFNNSNERKYKKARLAKIAKETNTRQLYDVYVETFERFEEYVVKTRTEYILPDGTSVFENSESRG